MPQVINGRVRDAAGRPVAEARIGYVSGPVPLPDIAALTGEDGSFALAAPAPGAYRISCTLPDGTSTYRAVEVTRGADVAVSFELGQ